MSTEYKWLIELKDTSKGCYVAGRGIGRMCLVQPTDCTAYMFNTKEQAQEWINMHIADKDQYHPVEHGFG